MVASPSSEGFCWQGSLVINARLIMSVKPDNRGLQDGQQLRGDYSLSSKPAFAALRLNPSPDALLQIVSVLRLNPSPDSSVGRA